MTTVRQWTGRETRALRKAMRVSIREFAEKLGVAERSVSKWEAARERTFLRPDTQSLLDTMFKQVSDDARERFALLLDDPAGPAHATGYSLSTVPAPAVVPTVAPASGPTAPYGRTVEIQTGQRSGFAFESFGDDRAESREDTMRRRQLLGFAALGAAGATGLGAANGTAALAALEGLRHDVLRAVADGDAFASVQEWERIAWDYGYAYSVTPPDVLLTDLSVDLLVARRQLDQTTDDAHRRELHRVIARLAAFTAMAWADLGNFMAERRWWRTAQAAADASGDLDLQVWIGGREIIQGLYERRPLAGLLDSADRLIALNAAPGAGLASILAGRAQALARMDRPAEAESGLKQLNDMFPTLPTQVAEDTDTIYGWSEQRLRHTESFVYTYLGDSRRAETAQDRALMLYPAHRYLARAQVRLHQAMCLVHDGEVTTGVVHAQQVINELPAAHRTDDVLELGRSVVQAVPATERHCPEVTALRELTIRAARPLK
jgi:tetratricopeptide (TPR) repeat protein